MCPCEANNSYMFHGEAGVIAPSLDRPGLGFPFAPDVIILPRAALR